MLRRFDRGAVSGAKKRRSSCVTGAWQSVAAGQLGATRSGFAQGRFGVVIALCSSDWRLMRMKNVDSERQYRRIWEARGSPRRAASEGAAVSTVGCVSRRSQATASDCRFAVRAVDLSSPRIDALERLRTILARANVAARRWSAGWFLHETRVRPCGRHRDRVQVLDEGLRVKVLSSDFELVTVSTTTANGGCARKVFKAWRQSASGRTKSVPLGRSLWPHILMCGQSGELSLNLEPLLGGSSLGYCRPMGRMSDREL